MQVLNDEGHLIRNPFNGYGWMGFCYCKELQCLLDQALVVSSGLRACQFGKDVGLDVLLSWDMSEIDIEKFLY